MRNDNPTGDTVDVRELASPDARSIASGVLGALAIAVFYFIGAESATVVVSLVALLFIGAWAIVQFRRASYSRAPEKSEIATKPIIWAAVGGLTTFAIAMVVDLLTSGFDALDGIPVFVRLIIFALFLILLGYIAWQVRGNVQYKRNEIGRQAEEIGRLGSAVRHHQETILWLLDRDTAGNFSTLHNNGLRTARINGVDYYLGENKDRRPVWIRGSVPQQGEETPTRPAPFIERQRPAAFDGGQTMGGFDEPYGTGGYRDDRTMVGMPTPPRRFTAPEPESERDVNGVTVTTDGTQFRGSDGNWYRMPYRRLDNDQRPWHQIPDADGNLPARTQQTPFPPRDEEAPGVGELRPPRRGRHGQQDTPGTRLDLGTPGAEDGPPADTELS